MTDIDQLRAEVTAAGRRKAAADAALTAAGSREQAAAGLLNEEFGITAEQVPDLIAAKKKEIEAEAGRVRAQLAASRGET